MGVRSGPKIPTSGSEFELVTNGTNLVATTGWSALNSGTLSVSNGALRVTPDSGGGTANSAARQDVPTVSGRSYTITLHDDPRASGNTAYTFVKIMGGGMSGTINTSATFSSATFYEHTFVATASTTSILLYNGTATAGYYVDWSNISVKPASSPLILSLDAFNIKSYAGEVGTDVNLNTPVAGVHDYTGTTYSANNEWTSDATKLTKTYDVNITTPLNDGYGATIISESGNAGYHHLSTMGGSGTGNHMISFYFKPITNDITDFRAGMLGDSSNGGDGGGGCTFNFVTGTVTAIGSSSGKVIVFEKLSNGWWFCACDINGRSGGWVGSIGPSMHTSYTGTAGNKKGYICGLQYSNKSYPTAYGDRSATDGWRDISGNGNHGTLTNMLGTGTTHFRNFNIMLPTENAYLDFDGTNDYIDCGSNAIFDSLPTFTACIWFKMNNLSSDMALLSKGTYSSAYSFFIQARPTKSGASKSYHARLTHDGSSSTVVNGAADNTWVADTWYHLVLIHDGTNAYYYENGEENGAKTAVGYTIGPGATAGTFKIGRLQGDESKTLDGQAAVATFYNAALTHAQVKDMYNSQRSRFGL